MKGKIMYIYIINRYRVIYVEISLMIDNQNKINFNIVLQCTFIHDIVTKIHV